MCWQDQQKLAGILLEAEAVAGNPLAVVVGIGTNVVAAPEGTPTPATSLAAIGVDIGAEELFGALSDSWAEFRSIWDGGRGFAEIRRLWLERAAGLGQPVAVQTGGATVAGIFDTIDDNRLHGRQDLQRRRGSRSRPEMSISAPPPRQEQPDGPTG